MNEPLNTCESLQPAPWNRRDVYFRIRVSRNLALAIFLSLLLHGLFFFGFHREAMKMPASNLPLDIRLVPAQRPKAGVVAREPVRKFVRKPAISVRRKLSRPAVIERIPAPAPALPAPRPAPKMSFLDYVNAARQRRDASQNEYPAAPQPVGPSREVRKAGTSGIFRILRMDERSAEFSFLGWHSEFSNSHKEIFDVDAGADGDIRHAVVRKMIEIIRRYYQGDFNWESERLGGVVVLSASLKDDRELEAFLTQEFFGSRPD